MQNYSASYKISPVKINPWTNKKYHVEKSKGLFLQCESVASIIQRSERAPFFFGRGGGCCKIRRVLFWPFQTPIYDQMESFVFSGLTDCRVSRVSNLLQLSFSISFSLKVDMPILTCIFFTFNWLTLTSEMHFVKFHLEVASCLLSRGKRKYVPLEMRLLWKYIRNYFLVYQLTSHFFHISKTTKNWKLKF